MSFNNEAKQNRNAKTKATTTITYNLEEKYK